MLGLSSSRENGQPSAGTSGPGPGAWRVSDSGVCVCSDRSSEGLCTG
jgi:hypothetical protein